MNSLKAISPVDGRYFRQTEPLTNYFSEYALIRYRIFVEVEYFIALCEIPLPQLSSIDKKHFESLRNIYRNFVEADATAIKEIEKTTNHDVKAVEYFIKNKFEQLGLSKYKEFIHFGLTSQDINNTAIPISIKEAMQQVLLPALANVIDILKTKSDDWKEVVILARTHGQPATPTLLGKELYVFVQRLIEQKDQLIAIKHSSKFGGATGNMNAHYVSYPKIDWHTWADKFVNENLGLHRSYPTTQIEHYDNIAAQFDAWKRINTILLDLCRDMWSYVSMDYFKQEIKKGEIGSSAMPHKVNPIDFENAEGNLGISSALAEHFAAKLPISRLQRDLTDSTVLRNIGVPFAHTLIALKSIEKGLNKILLNKEKIDSDLENNWAVVAEAIQTVLRSELFPEPYEKLKELTRKGERITQKEIQLFIDSLEVNDDVKNKLKAITPFNYFGKFI
ncbi:adenylosuccinate lyase [Bacteroidota bacterium]|nr:adenylosuccinate lyase [Bacteroidota bacterium]